MLTDVILIVTLEHSDDDDRCKSFAVAMSRRGWWRMPDTELGFRIGFSNASHDEEIVQICEQDVRESAYVAGAGQFDATCLIAPDSSPSEATAG